MTATPLKLLVLGATGRIGPHHVRAALDRGHKVTTLARKFSPKLGADVEQIIGDRDNSLEAVKTRNWDAVLDLATYGPRWVRELGMTLKERVRHYTFISTVSVYDTPSNNRNGTDEAARLIEFSGDADQYSVNQPAAPHYGALKAMCEQEAETQFPGRVLILRPGHIVGPDGAGPFLYWAARMEQGGEVLAAGDPLARVQVIDVRDMAEWIIRMVEEQGTGVFNAVGPAQPMGWAELLVSLRSVSPAPITLTWAPAQWVTEQIGSAWSNLLFFPTECGVSGLMQMSNRKALAQGLTLRPISVSAADALAWYKRQSKEEQAQSLMGVSGMSSSLEQSMVRERELLSAWHAESAVIEGARL